jgi:phage shock protein PspC (stress-responsive transcriptional regulator)
METFTDTAEPQPATASQAGRPPLRRVYEGRMLAGVAAGIAGYLGVDVTLIRIAFVVFTFLGGAGIPAYLACLLLIPEEGTDESIASSLLDSFQLGSR